MARLTAGELRNRFEAYFDPGHRQRVADAKSAVAEVEYRENQTGVIEDIQQCVNTQAFKDLEVAVLAESKMLPFSVDGLDTAGAYWRRHGLEVVLELLDSLRRQAENGVDDGIQDG